MFLSLSTLFDLPLFFGPGPVGPFDNRFVTPVETIGTDPFSDIHEHRGMERIPGLEGRRNTGGRRSRLSSRRSRGRLAPACAL